MQLSTPSFACVRTGNGVLDFEEFVAMFSAKQSGLASLFASEGVFGKFLGGSFRGSSGASGDSVAATATRGKGSGTSQSQRAPGGRRADTLPPTAVHGKTGSRAWATAGDPSSPSLPLSTDGRQVSEAPSTSSGDAKQLPPAKVFGRGTTTSGGKQGAAVVAGKQGSVTTSGKQGLAAASGKHTRSKGVAGSATGPKTEAAGLAVDEPPPLCKCM